MHRKHPAAQAWPEAFAVPFSARAHAALPGLLFGAFSVLLFLAYARFLRLHEMFPSASIGAFAAVLLACVAASRIGYDGVVPPLRTLMRGLAAACGLYNLALFPGMPAIAHNFGGHAGAILAGAWAVAALAAVLAMWRPAWLLLCAYYVFWIKNVAGYLTGFEMHTLLDILPLYQLPAYLALAVVALQAVRGSRLHASLAASSVEPQIVLLWLGIGVQAANYFYSALTKATLDGGLSDWVLHNDNVNLFLVALHNKQLLWGDWTALTAWTAQALTFGARPLAAAILLGQLCALAAFSSKRLMLLLFGFFDALHMGIFVLSGANFWTWFMVNLAILAALAQMPRAAFNWRTGLAGAALILAAPLWTHVARLGWYDTLALNAVRLEALSADGRRTRVPMSAFGFYSYPLAHMSFGLPPGSYVPTGTNGGTSRSAIRKQAERCEFSNRDSVLAQNWQPDRFSALLRGYHRYMLERVGPDGHWTNQLYPHHFWSAPSVAGAFADLDIRSVTTYALVTEALCLQARTGAVARTLYANEFLIDVAR